jgi:hypothetical protein
LPLAASSEKALLAAHAQLSGDIASISRPGTPIVAPVAAGTASAATAVDPRLQARIGVVRLLQSTLRLRTRS